MINCKLDISQNCNSYIIIIISIIKAGSRVFTSEANDHLIISLRFLT